MNDATGTACGNDIKSLLDKGLAYLALDLPSQQLLPFIGSTTSKEETRGHNHIVLSRLLCPVRLLADFDQNPDEYDKIFLFYSNLTITSDIARRSSVATLNLMMKTFRRYFTLNPMDMILKT